MKIYVDGSGKTGRYCYVIDGRAPKLFEEKGLTNNQAEYKAIIAALRDNKIDDIEIFSDSELVVRQLNHIYSIKNEKLRLLAQKVWELCEDRNIIISWIPRNQNKAGKILG